MCGQVPLETSQANVLASSSRNVGIVSSREASSGALKSICSMEFKRIGQACRRKESECKPVKAHFQWELKNELIRFEYSSRGTTGTHHWPNLLPSKRVLAISTNPLSQLLFEWSPLYLYYHLHLNTWWSWARSLRFSQYTREVPLFGSIFWSRKTTQLMDG